MEDTVIRTHDTVFKYIFGRPETKDVLLGLINSVVCPGDNDEKICDIQLVDRELNPVQKDGKLCRVDLHGVTSTGIHIDIEVQNVFEPYMDSRALYYWADIYVRQLGEGDEYQKLRPTYLINILNFNFFRNFPKYISECQIVFKDTGEQLNGDLRLFFLELPKWVAQKRKAQSSLERWLAFLSHGNPAEIEEYAMLDPDIRKAIEAEKQFIADPEQMSKYRQYKKALKDWNSSMEQAKYEEAASIACNMLSKGVSIQLVHEYTKLPINKIEELQQQLAQA